MRGSGGHGPHAGQRLATVGAPLDSARPALVMLHGRSGGPEDMIELADHLTLPDIAVLAPKAAGGPWSPDSFLAPLAINEPGLSSGISVVLDILDDLARQGVGPDRIVLIGFSQGACLAAEVAARLARPFRALVGPVGRTCRYG